MSRLSELFETKTDKITIKSLDQIYELLKDRSISIDTTYSYSHKIKTKNKSVNMSLGRIWFNLLLPDEYPKLINEPVDKKLSGKIITEIYEQFDPEIGAECLTRINKHVFIMSSILPVTFDAGSLIVPDDIVDRKKKLISKDMPPEQFGDVLENLSKEYVKSLEGTGIGNIVDSGAKCSPQDLGVLQIAKGPAVDIEGNISPIIEHGFAEGLSGEEFYTACAEARRTYYIRAVGTSDPGYLARQTIFSNASTTLDSKDCKSKKYLNLFIKSDLLNRLIGRYYLNEQTNKLEMITADHTNLINTTIQLRSPLFCKSPNGICKICYGNDAEKSNTKYVGLIAGSVINEAGVEGYSMKARHNTSQVNIKSANFISDIIHI